MKTTKFKVGDEIDPAEMQYLPVGAVVGDGIDPERRRWIKLENGKFRCHTDTTSSGLNSTMWKSMPVPILELPDDYGVLTPEEIDALEVGSIISNRLNSRMKSEQGWVGLVGSKATTPKRWISCGWTLLYEAPKPEPKKEFVRGGTYPLYELWDLPDDSYLRTAGNVKYNKRLGEWWIDSPAGGWHSYDNIPWDKQCNAKTTILYLGGTL